MNALTERLSSDFLPLFLGGMLVNFQIALVSIAIGLAIGLALALARLQGGLLGSAAVWLISLMRAAPTFVVMFFLLNAIPRDAKLFGEPFSLSGVMIVALSLVPYSAAYVADAGVDALQNLRSGSTLGALLFLPNITRAFFVLVMSSSAGAAIGVTEAITIILRQASQLPTLGDQLILFAVGIVLFGIPLQLSFAFIGFVQRSLGRFAGRRTAKAA